MTLVYADRVRETTTTSGTGSVTLGGAQLGFQSFSAGIGVANTCHYCIADVSSNTWEVGLGTLSGATTLQRTTVLASSNANALVNFSAASKDVFNTDPATFFNQFVLTQGSILFAGSGSTVTQDNANLFWDATNHRLGIGTAAPANQIQTVGVQPASVGTTPGTTAGTTVSVTGAVGGDTSIATTGIGGAGGAIAITAGVGGQATAAATSSTSGAGGAITITAGAGAVSNFGVTTNKGGAGGNISLIAGAAGTANNATGASTGGAGGSLTLTATAGADGVAQGTGTANTGGAGGNITLTAGVGGQGNTGPAGSNIGGAGGNITFTAGNSRSIDNLNTGLQGGAITFVGGTGGTNNRVAGGNVIGGRGGDVNFTMGVGGSAQAGTSTQTSGAGGNFSLSAGNGGICTTNTGSVNNRGGIGSAINIAVAGTGTGGAASGSGSNLNTGGAGCAINLNTGAGGVASGSTGTNTSGAGGSLTVLLGNGATTTTATGTTNTGGSGGSYLVTTGNGGAANSAATTNTGGAAGNITYTLGTGGTGTSTTGADGFFGFKFHGVATVIKPGGCIVDHYADAGTPNSTTETDLYSDTLAASTLAANGEKITATYACTLTNSTSTKEVRVYFAGTVIFDSGALTISASSEIVVNLTIIRDSSTSVRYSVTANTTGASTGTFANVGKLTGLTLTNTQVLKITGQSGGVGTAANDVLAILGTVNWTQAA